MVAPVAAAAAGAVFKGIGGVFANRSRDKKIAKILRRRGEQQADIDARVLGEVSGLASTTPEAERAAALDQFMTALRGARAGVSPAITPAAGSERYAADTEALNAGLGQFSDQEADIASRIIAPLRMREREALRLGKLHTDVQGKERRIQSSDFLANLKLSQLRPNPLYSIAGDLLGGYAQGAALGGYDSNSPLGLKSNVKPAGMKVYKNG